MSSHQLQAVLDGILDTGEIVIRPQLRFAADELLQAWREARADATAALEAWRTLRSREAFAAYRAAEDRADAAQDTLAARRNF
jgi:hypothetical protein